MRARARQSELVAAPGRLGSDGEARASRRRQAANGPMRPRSRSWRSSERQSTRSTRRDPNPHEPRSRGRPRHGPGELGVLRHGGPGSELCETGRVDRASGPPRRLAEPRDRLRRDSRPRSSGRRDASGSRARRGRRIPPRAAPALGCAPRSQPSAPQPSAGRRTFPASVPGSAAGPCGGAIPSTRIAFSPSPSFSRPSVEERSWPVSSRTRSRR
jgi:hypothetical protein